MTKSTSRRDPTSTPKRRLASSRSNPDPTETCKGTPSARIIEESFLGNQVKVDSNSGAMTIEAKGKLSIKAASITIEATGTLELKANATLTIRGTLVQIN